MGPGRPRVPQLGQLVRRRRRPVHRLHVRRGARAALRVRGDRLLRAALRGHRVPAGVPDHDQALVGVQDPRLRDRRGLRPGPVRFAHPGAGRGHHRGRGHDALHRPQPAGNPGGAGHDGHQRLVAAGHRVRGAGRVHLQVRRPGARADLVRQGHPGLHRDRGGHLLHPDPAGRLGTHLRQLQRPLQGTPPGTASLLTAGNQWQYITLALGSAFAIFLYPHSVTGVLTTRNRAVVKRTLAALPIYSFVLGLIALFGVMAIAGKIKPLVGANGKPNTNTVVPNLFQHMFPSWFTGLAFSMIVIGALVPAAFMSIAAANLFTRNIYKEYLRPQASPQEQTQVSKLVSLLVKVGALLFILLINPQFSIDLQLLGGAMILQTLPSVMIGLYSRWLHRGALITGWAAGMIVSIWTFYA